ncbi:unnamed protein product [Lactuca saligna]|uniref:DUF4283 domain-containing protein n=1 Tax=Lactuca saligna TaxID=75948 RepID=A0AA35YTZ1_LACSI|nr:unnamed protein product [Lactuca saligna]
MDSSGRWFAFIRFTGVKYASDMEARLQGISCMGRILMINIAKFERKEINKNKREVPAARRFQEVQRAPNDAWRDGRTFAIVAAGFPSLPPPQPPTLSSSPIQLRSCTFMEYWLKSELTLVGEVRSYTHLTSLPDSIFNREDGRYKAKYLGGLKIGIRFRNPSDVRNFMEDKEFWRLWFKWIDRGDKVDIKEDRIAWLKVVGLPIHLWDEGNLRAITRKLGVISKSMEISMSKIDVSYMKICVITTSLKRISEEIIVAVDNRIFKIGVYKIDDDWKPFSTHNYDNDSEYEDEDDEDAISNTMIVDDENKSDDMRETLEEGEIDSEFDSERVPGS